MTTKQYYIFRSQEPAFQTAVSHLLESAMGAGCGKMVRMVFFGAPKDNSEYIEQNNIIKACAATRCGDLLTAYVAQQPLCCSLAAEVSYVAEDVQVEFKGDYALLDGCEILSAAIQADLMLDIGGQAEQIFSRMSEILAAEDIAVDDIVRQWNYIERITALSPQGQHYQLFNDARSAFYAGCKWSNGYPAATGIGAQWGGVVVIFDALRNSSAYSRPVDNPLQISAHSYSQKVLINSIEKHKTTPKFERARYMCGHKPMAYISGTAAIRGEESCREGLAEQARLTMENIDHLTGVENLKQSGVADAQRLEYCAMRAYLKDNKNWSEAKAWLKENYPAVDMLYLWADICREELLIEIEGFAV